MKNEVMARKQTDDDFFSEDEIRIDIPKDDDNCMNSPSSIENSPVKRRKIKFMH